MNKKLVASITLASFTQFACYNSYFIDKTELEKLEATVEPQEVVEVYGDCASPASASVFELGGPVYAQADTDEEDADAPPSDPGSADDVMSDIEDIAGEADADETDDAAAGETDETAGQKTSTQQAGNDKAAAKQPARAGCKSVQVSGANALQVVTAAGNERVTPFNFIMSGGQLVSPEYDLLVPLQQVEGAKVREFSTFKTVTTIVLVSAVAVGTFVGISILAPESDGFQR